MGSADSGNSVSWSESSSRGVVAAIALSLVVAVFAVYSQVGSHEFVGYDDFPYIVDNPTIRQEIDGPSLWRTFSEPEHANWIPLTKLSLRLNHAADGLDPTGYLLTNVALHAATSVLLFLFFCSITDAKWRSGFVAAVFALHPLHVESVAWASQRKDVLCAFFFVLTLFAYLRFLKGRNFRNYALLAGCFAAALLAKPMAVTLPFVLLLLDYWPLARLQGDPTRAWPSPKFAVGALVEKLPLFVLAAACAVVAYIAQGGAGNFNYAETLLVEARVAIVANAYLAYLADSFWPSGLAVFYPIPIDPPSRWLTAAALGLLLSLTALAIRVAPRLPYVTMGWLWFIGMLVPVAGVVHVGMQARADRYMYLPQIGLTIALAWGAVELWAGREGEPGRLYDRYVRHAVMAAAAVMLLGFGVISWRQVGYWRDSIALFSHAVAVTRDNHLAHYNLAAALGQAGRIEEANAQQDVAHEIMLREAAERMTLTAH